MRPQVLTLPDLDRKLDDMPEGTLHQITRSDYERLFGLNDVALGRLRNFAKTHSCVTSFADHAIIFRKKIRSSI